MPVASMVPVASIVPVHSPGADGSNPWWQYAECSSYHYSAGVSDRHMPSYHHTATVVYSGNRHCYIPWYPGTLKWRRSYVKIYRSLHRIILPYRVEFEVENVIK